MLEGGDFIDEVWDRVVGMFEEVNKNVFIKRLY